MDKDTEDIFNYRAGMLINRYIKMGMISVVDVVNNACIFNNSSYIYIVAKYVDGVFDNDVFIDKLTNAMYDSKDVYYIKRYEEDILGSYSKKKSI